MRRFLLYVVVSVAALAVLAPLGVGSRAQAGYLYHAGLRPAPGMVADEFNLSLLEDLPQSCPEPAPAAKDVSRRLPPALPGPRCDTGPHCSTSAAGDLTSSTGCQAGLLPDAQCAPPLLITLLGAPHSESVPDPAIASIFHPPRAAAGNRASLPLPTRAAPGHDLTGGTRQGLCPWNVAGTEHGRSLNLLDLLERETV